MVRWHPYHLMFATGIAFLVVRAILDSQFRNSTLLYLLVPFGLSILLHALTPRSGKSSVGWRYLNHLRDATIIFLATSALLFEGFICVLMFMPIYYFGMTIGFLFSLLAERQRKGNTQRLGVYVIPAIVLTLSMEGLAEPVTVARDREAAASAVIEAGVAELQANMAKPIAFTGERHWFLTLFPLPTHVEAGTLKTGDVHALAFTYKRWLFANYHHGTMRVRLAEVSPTLIRTEIVEDTSYLSHYMKIDGTEVRFEELGPNRTRVTLTVKYNRLLDPYWYFGPLEQFAAEHSARYLIESVIARRHG